MQNFYKVIVAMGLIFSIVTLTSCGKMASPQPIDGSNYPHSYPRI